MTPEARRDPAVPLARLVGVVDALRENCGWTRRLTPERLAPYLVEEAAEVSETVAAKSWGLPLASELGDVLFQVLLHSRLAEERGDFTLADVIEALESKLLRRNTHVFGPDGEVLDDPDHDPGAAEAAWLAAKVAEREASGDGPAREDPLRGLPVSLSSLALAQKALGRAEGKLTAHGEDASSGTGRDHQSIGEALLAHVRAARAAGVDADRALRDALARELGPRPGESHAER